MAKIVLTCMCCLNPFEREPRGDEECETIRRMLLIIDNTFRPPVCDTCLAGLEQTMTAPQDFHDSPNFLLRHGARFPDASR